MRYYGITIGPIIETLSLASKPAGLWYASYMFSDITRNLCEYLSENNKIRILAPYYEKNEPIDGVGSYFDKIFFTFDEKDKNVTEEFVQTAIQNVKLKIGERLANDIRNSLNQTTDNSSEVSLQKVIRFIQNYICIHYISITENERENRNISEALTPYLDTLELYKNIQSCGEKNYLLMLFEGKSSDPNKYIKESRLVKTIAKTAKENFQLFREQQNHIKNLAYIAGAGKVKEYNGEEFPDTDGWKKWKYYAVIQADGDHLGNVSKALKTEMKDIFEIELKVSKICKDYTKDCAEIIRKYGGTTIYAGGDDLLFLAPIQNREGITIFEQCKKISEIYNKKFEKINEKLPQEEKTTLSMGVSIYYWKFPLYEALENARNQLFKYAKKTRNTLSLTLDKASGNKGNGNVRFQYYFNSAEERAFIDFLKETNKKGMDNEAFILQSVLYHLKEHKKLFLQALTNKEKTLKNCMDNMFENSMKTEYLENSIKMMTEISEHCCNVDNGYKNIISILQLVHFFAEKGE